MVQIVAILAPYNSKRHCSSDVFWRETILTLYYIRGMTGPPGVHQQKDDTLLLCFNGSKIYHRKCCLIPGTWRHAQGVIIKINQKNWGRFWTWLSHNDSNGQGVMEPASSGKWGCLLITSSVQTRGVSLKLSLHDLAFCLIFTICFNPRNFQQIWTFNFINTYFVATLHRDDNLDFIMHGALEEAPPVLNSWGKQSLQKRAKRERKEVP